MVPCQCVRQVARRGLCSYAPRLSARRGASGGQHLCLVRLLGRCEEARGVVRGVGGRLCSPSATTTTTAMDNTHHTRFLRTPPSAFDNACHSRADSFWMLPEPDISTKDDDSDGRHSPEDRRACSLQIPGLTRFSRLPAVPPRPYFGANTTRSPARGALNHPYFSPFSRDSRVSYEHLRVRISSIIHQRLLRESGRALASARSEAANASSGREERGWDTGR